MKIPAAGASSSSSSSLLLLLLAAASPLKSVFGQATCSQATNCLNCAVRTTSGEIPNGCSWCQVRGSPSEGVCGGTAEMTNGVTCDLTKSFQIDAVGISDRLQDLCAYQSSATCESCFAAGGSWGQLENIHGQTIARCFVSRFACQDERGQTDPFTLEDLYVREKSLCPSECEDPDITVKTVTGDPPVEPIESSNPAHDECAKAHSCLGCGLVGTGAACRWCSEDRNWHEGACIGAGTGVGTFATDYCPTRSAMFEAKSDYCSLQAPTCDVCTSGGGAWAVYYSVIGDIAASPDGEDLNAVDYRRCFASTEACKNVVDASDDLTELFDLGGYPAPTRLCSTDCTAFTSIERVGTSNFHVNDNDDAASSNYSFIFAAIVATGIAAALSF